jgi:hypothetical protein
VCRSAVLGSNQEEVKCFRVLSEVGESEAIEEWRGTRSC